MRRPPPAWYPLLSRRLPPKRAAARWNAMAAFTLFELLIATSMSAVVFVVAISGIVALQRSYIACDQYSAGLADQMRLLDYLALDLRRAVAAPTLDADGNGIKITIANYYFFRADDPQHSVPQAVVPVVDGAGGTFTYGDPQQKTIVSYRWNANGDITRDDPNLPYVLDPVTSTYKPPGPQVIASNMTSFPVIAPMTADSPTALQYSVTFHSIFQPFAPPDASNAVTLHNVTFIRSQQIAN